MGLGVVADVAQSVEREALNLVVAGSSPVVGCFPFLHSPYSNLKGSVSSAAKPLTFNPNVLTCSCSSKQQQQLLLSLTAQTISELL